MAKRDWSPRDLSTTLILWLLLAIYGGAQDLASRIDHYLNIYTQLGRFSGSVLIARDGQVLLSKGYGMANLEHDVPNTPRTKFRIGSLTKQFTAMAVLQLQEKGILDVQDTLQKFLPDCPPAWRKITIHHLLTHTAGIPNFTSFPHYKKTMMVPSSVAETIARFKDKPLEFEPGERHQYSNSGYVLLGHIIERASGQPYESFLRQNIFEPLGMANTGYDHHATILKDRAAGYTWGPEGLMHAPYIDMSIPGGAGGLYSTVEDLHLWDQALYTEKLVSKKALERMFTPFKENYGYGWVIKTQFNRKLVSHGGDVNGFKAFIARYPDQKVSIIVLGNLDTGEGEIIAHGLAAVAFGEKYELPRVRTAIRLDPSVYDHYLGQYELAPQVYITISHKGDRLMSQITGQPKLEIFPESESVFFMKIVDAQITFVKNERKEVTHLILRYEGQDMRAKRVRK